MRISIKMCYSIEPRERRNFGNPLLEILVINMVKN